MFSRSAYYSCCCLVRQLKHSSGRIQAQPVPQRCGGWDGALRPGSGVFVASPPCSSLVPLLTTRFVPGCQASSGWADQCSSRGSLLRFQLSEAAILKVQLMCCRSGCFALSQMFPASPPACARHPATRRSPAVLEPCPADLPVPSPPGLWGDEEVPAPCQPVLTQRHREPRSPPPASRLPYIHCCQLLASPARIFGFSPGGFHPQHPQRHGTGGGLLAVVWPEPSEHQGLLRPRVPRCSETCWALQVNAKP